MLNASSGGVFFFFQPVVGTLLGWLVLGETISMMFWVGAVLILLGVLLVITDKQEEQQLSSPALSQKTT